MAEEEIKETAAAAAEAPAAAEEVKVKKGNRKDLGRPTTTPIQNKEALMSFLAK